MTLGTWEPRQEVLARVEARDLRTAIKQLYEVLDQTVAVQGAGAAVDDARGPGLSRDQAVVQFSEDGVI